MVDLFTAAGQSNMVGQGDSSLSPDPATDTAYEWDTSQSTVVQLDDPVGSNPSANTGSCLPQFAVTYNNLTGNAVGIVQTASGGGSQAQEVDSKTWDPEVAGSLYDAAISATNDAIAGFQNAGYSVDYRGVLWAQGEADAQAIDDGTIDKTLYKNTFEQMIGQWRSDLSRSSLPFYVCQTGIYPPDDTAGFADVRAAQAEVAANDSDVVLASWIQKYFDQEPNYADRMNENVANDLHYNQAGLNDMGGLAAAKAAKYLTETASGVSAAVGSLPTVSGVVTTDANGVIVAGGSGGGGGGGGGGGASVSGPTGPVVAEFDERTQQPENAGPTVSNYNVTSH